MRFCTSNAIRESRYRTSLSRTKFFFDCDEIFAFKSRNIFCAVQSSVNSVDRGKCLPNRTSCQIIINLQIFLIRIHRQVQRRHRVSLRCAHRARALLRAHGVLSRDRHEGRARGSRGSRRRRLEHGGRHCRFQCTRGLDILGGESGEGWMCWRHGAISLSRVGR